jgi:hypothetical protein
MVFQEVRIRFRAGSPAGCRAVYDRLIGAAIGVAGSLDIERRERRDGRTFYDGYCSILAPVVSDDGDETVPAEAEAIRPRRQRRAGGRQ